MGDYSRNIDLLRDKQKRLKTRRRKGLINIDDMITAGIAAIIATPHVTFAGPSVRDVVTVPFDPHEGNKSDARYDVEHLKPLYDKAEGLRMRRS